MDVLNWIGDGLWNAFRMAWEVGWALILGFTLSGIVQAWIPRSRMESALGARDLRTVSLATGLGAASSSCSYAAVAIAKSMLQKGASLVVGDGVPVRVDEPRLRARDRDLDLPRLGVHARGARRRRAPDRVHVGRAPALRHAQPRGGGAQERNRGADAGTSTTRRAPKGSPGGSD